MIQTKLDGFRSVSGPVNPTHITSFKDGQLFKEICLKNRYTSKDVLIFIQLYFDDFSLTPNPATQLSVVYFTVSNLPPYLTSSREHIYLLYICKRSHLNKIHFEGLFESLFRDFEILKANPIQLSGGYKAVVEFEVMVADNSGNCNFAFSFAL